MYLYVFMRATFLNFVLVVNDCFLARMVWQQQNHDLTDTVQRVYYFKVHQIGKQFKLLHRHKLVQRPQLASFPGHGSPAALRSCRWPIVNSKKLDVRVQSGAWRRTVWWLYWGFIVDGSAGACRIRAGEMCKFIRF